MIQAGMIVLVMRADFCAKEVGYLAMCLRYDIPVWQNCWQNNTATIEYRIVCVFGYEFKRSKAT